MIALSSIPLFMSVSTVKGSPVCRGEFMVIPIKKKMSQGKPWLLPLALVLLVLWLGWRFWLAYQPEPVRLQGQIEAQQYSVSPRWRAASTRCW